MFRLFAVFIVLLGGVCFFNPLHANDGPPEAADPPEALLGERLFNDFRFSQYFFVQSQGNVNAILQKGAGELDQLVLIDGKNVEHPFRGQAMSCVACHMVEQARELHALSMRAYADYASLTPRPFRSEDPAPTTLRNTQMLIMPVLSGIPTFFHWDGEFNSLTDLVVASSTGRNMGWLPSEKSLALQNIVNVIRQDDGSGDLAQENGGYSYAEIFKSSDPLISSEFRLPEAWRLDLEQASDQQIVVHMSKLMAAYMNNLTFNKNEDGHYQGSPYDIFLQKNDLPTSPAADESATDYAERLLGLVDKLKSPKFVTAQDGSFATHSQKFEFGEAELQGLKLFLTVNPKNMNSAGACVACHQLPHFTDGGFHNIGVSQFQYEVVHGRGTFKNLSIPSLTERNGQVEIYGIPTEKAPGRLQRLAALPVKEDKLRADLGLWNYFANSDYLASQADRRTILQHSLPELNLQDKSDAELLPLTMGMMKTPTLRNLGHSAPYFSTGHISTLRLVTNFYFAMSNLSRRGELRNADPKLSKVFLRRQDLPFLERFLRALNEDYD